MKLIKNGVIWDGLGKKPYAADILIENGMIKKIAPNIKNDNAEVIDVQGCMVLPGFIDSLNIYGCRGPGWDSNDISELSDPVLPNMNIVFSFDQDGMNFQEVYKYGVTASGICPSPSNVLAGYAGVFYCYGHHPYKMLLKEKAAQIASVTEATKKPYGSKNKMPMTRMGSFSLLVEILRKALNYNPEKGYDAKLDALIPVLEGKIPLFVNCATKSEMKGVLHAMKEFENIKLVLTGAFALDNSFEEVKSGKVPVIMGDVTDAFSPYSEIVDFKVIKEMLDNNAVISCSSCGDQFASGKESLLWNAIQWYKNGIDANNVLKAITSTPAKLLGVDNLTGSLEEGKRADLSVWSENPICTYRASLKAVYIQGENLLEKERYHSCW